MKKQVIILGLHVFKKFNYFFQTSFDIWAEGTEFDINNLRTYSVTIISSPILSILPLISSLSASFIHSLSFWYSISLLNMTSYQIQVSILRDQPYK